MASPSISFSQTNKQLPLIFLVGVLLGFANFAIGVWDSLAESLIQQVIISLAIGYGTLLVAYNSPLPPLTSLQQAKMLGLMALVGLLGSEIQALVWGTLFEPGTYWPFTQGGTYIFNLILSPILGWVTYNWVSKGEVEQAPQPISPNEPTPKLETLPIKKGDTVQLYRLEEVLYFEAYDNYSFLYDRQGNKQLCQYPLSVLEPQLVGEFIRIHRKYLINRSHIRSLQPHLKGRYVITFSDQAATTLTSGASYAEALKALTRL